jgi:uncharacterized membrane protein YczE
MIVRFVQLQIGILLCGLGLALVLNADLGADPWTVFHVGVANNLALSVGTVIQVTGVFFLLMAWALFQTPVGIGSIFNMALVGPWIDLFLKYLPSTSKNWVAISELSCGLFIIGLATALYITADMGAGPRDSFILGLSQKSGFSIKHTRFAVEIVALGAGFLLDGPIGIGTVIFALGIGPLMQFFLDRLRRFSLAAEKK